MMLGFVLCALFYKERNEKPFPFVLAMILVCGSSAYGIVLCGGISLVWLYEIGTTESFPISCAAFEETGGFSRFSCSVRPHCIL